MKNRALLGLVAAFAVTMLALPAGADSITEDFSLWTPSTPNRLSDAEAQAHGWNYNLGAGRDIELVANGIDGNSIRISNAVTDQQFSDWLFSKPLGTPAVEGPSATDGNEFVAEFDIASTTPNVEQPGLQVSVSPQTGEGARMSFLRFNDSAGGIDVYFADVENNGDPKAAIQIADNQPRTGFHVRVVLDLYAGPHNDVANVFINNSGPLVPSVLGGFDGFFAPVDKPTVAVNKAKAGQAIPLKFKITTELPTTWEDYYRFNCESNVPCPAEGEWDTRQVDSLIFQARAGAGTAPASDGKGYFIDNVSLTSSDATTLPTGAGAAGDASVFGEDPFTATKVACDLTEGVDPIEVYAPGASELKYDAATGIWHYNWKTYKDMAGMCVDMHLTLLPSANALFQIVK